MGRMNLPGGGDEGLLYNISDGSDGDLLIDSDLDITSELNGPPIIKQLTGLTINENCTLSVTQPCKGLMLYVDGDVNINGHIDMSKKAPYGVVMEDVFPLINKNTNLKTLPPEEVTTDWTLVSLGGGDFTPYSGSESDFNEDPLTTYTVNETANDRGSWNGQDVFEIDLGEVKAVTKVVFNIYVYGVSGIFYISDDGVTWEEVYGAYTSYGPNEQFDILNVNCRYLKLGTRSSPTSGVVKFSFSSLKIFVKPSNQSLSDTESLTLLNPIANAYRIRGGAGGMGGAGIKYGGEVCSKGGHGGQGRVFCGGYGGGGGSGSNNLNGGSVLFPDDGGIPGLLQIAYGSGNVQARSGQGAPGGRMANSVQCPEPWKVKSGITGSAKGGGGGASGGSAYFSNIPSAPEDGTDGEEAGGGILIIASGNINIGANGTISANGGNGGDGGTSVASNTGSYYAGAPGGGGGAGGGVVALFYGGTVTNNGVISVSGGDGGDGGLSSNNQQGNSGTPGKEGTILIKPLSNIL